MIKTYIVNGKKNYEVYVSERDHNKKLVARRKRGITSEREAKALEFQLKCELQSLVKKNSSMKWGQWTEEILSRVKMRFKHSTYLNYSSYLSNWVPEEWRDLLLEEIKPGDVYKVIDSTKNDLSQVSQLTFLKILRRIFQEAVEEGLIGHNPARSISIRAPESNKNVLTTSEVETLLRHAKECHHRFYHIWCFAVQTGMRSGEMYALLWKDVDFERNLISVNKQWTRKDGVTPTKSRENRVVPMSSNLRGFLLELKQEFPYVEHVLPRPVEWTHGDQAKVLREFCKLIGITEVKFHDLRATFITNLLSQGVSLVKVMSIVGHKKMETTDIYLRLAGVDVKGATEALSYGVPAARQDAHVIAVNFSKNRDDK